MITSLIEEKELRQEIRRDAEEIRRVCSSGLVVTPGGYHRDPVQTLLMRRKSGNESLFLPIIESSAIDAEKMAAGAGELFLKIFQKSMVEDLGRLAIGAEIDNEWRDIHSKIKTSSIPARKRDFSKTLGLGEESTKSHIVRRVFEETKAGDRVFIKKSPNQDTKIYRETGYCFEDLGIDPRFLSKGSWIRKNARIILVDGIIESVGEIHSFLEDMSKNKTPSVIFCIDALPDISETLVKNFLMGNLDTMLVKVPVVENHINTLADLGVIFGIEPISASAGETISSGINNSHSFAERISITRNKISIDDKSQKQNVSRHIREIRKRLEDDINLFPVLEGRLNSLSASTIHVSVGMTDQKNDPWIVEKLDRLFRSLPRIFKSGFIEKNDFQGFSQDKIDLLFEKNHAVSAEMAYQAIKIFLSTRETIYSASVGIKSV